MKRNIEAFRNVIRGDNFRINFIRSAFIRNKRVPITVTIFKILLLINVHK